MLLVDLRRFVGSGGRGFLGRMLLLLVQRLLLLSLVLSCLVWSGLVLFYEQVELETCIHTSYFSPVLSRFKALNSHWLLYSQQVL